MKEKMVIYQLLPRLFGNLNTSGKAGGGIEENGCGRFADITQEVIKELQILGITHIWLTGVIRHATGTDYSSDDLPASHPGIVKGKAGSPYAINDYYDLDPDLATSVGERFNEFKELIERVHDAGLKVIIDFVPNHVARDYTSRTKPVEIHDLGEGDDPTVQFHPQNNFYYLPGTVLDLHGYREEPARATGNDVFHPNPQPHDWYETVKLNYGIDYQTGDTFFNPIPDTWIKMTDILSFWAGKGVDGFRCDMAGMVPESFWRFAIGNIKNEYPAMTFIAELYEPERYFSYIEIAGFDYLYDKAGFYDTIREVIIGKRRASEITSIWKTLQGLDNKMLRFIENHDEQRLASREFAGNPWPGLPALALATFMNNGPVMIYAGQEYGESADPNEGGICSAGRTSIFEYSFIPAIRRWMAGVLSDQETNHFFSVKQILTTLQTLPVLSRGEYYDLSYANMDLDQRGKICSFLRYAEADPRDDLTSDSPEILLVCVSFDPTILQAKVRLPQHALETLGLGNSTRLLLKSLEPAKVKSNQLLTSQIVSSGIPIDFNPAGWAILGIS